MGANQSPTQAINRINLFDQNQSSGSSLVKPSKSGPHVLARDARRSINNSPIMFLPIACMFLLLGVTLLLVGTCPGQAAGLRQGHVYGTPYGNYKYGTSEEPTTTQGMETTVQTPPTTNFQTTYQTVTSQRPQGGDSGTTTSSTSEPDLELDLDSEHSEDHTETKRSPDLYGMGITETGQPASMRPLAPVWRRLDCRLFCQKTGFSGFVGGCQCGFTLFARKRSRAV